MECNANALMLRLRLAKGDKWTWIQELNFAALQEQVYTNYLWFANYVHNSSDGTALIIP